MQKSARNARPAMSVSEHLRSHLNVNLPELMLKRR